MIGLSCLLFDDSLHLAVKIHSKEVTIVNSHEHEVLELLVRITH